MRKWFKIAAPLGIAAFLVSVLALGFHSPKSDAAVCLGAAGGTNYSGTVSGSGSAVTQFDFCSSPSVMLVVTVSWSKNNADLGLKVTEPNGTVHVVDVSNFNSNFETYVQGAPLPEGTWTVQVFNNKKGSVAYGLGIHFLCDGC